MLGPPSFGNAARSGMKPRQPCARPISQRRIGAQPAFISPASHDAGVRGRRHVLAASTVLHPTCQEYDTIFRHQRRQQGFHRVRPTAAIAYASMTFSATRWSSLEDHTGSYFMLAPLQCLGTTVEPPVYERTEIRAVLYDIDCSHCNCASVFAVLVLCRTIR